MHVISSGLEEVLRLQADAQTESFDHHATIAKRTVILEPEEKKVEDAEIVTLEGQEMAGWTEDQTNLWLTVVLKACERCVSIC